MSRIEDVRHMAIDCESSEEDFTIVMKSGCLTNLESFGHHETLRIKLAPDEVDAIAQKIREWQTRSAGPR